METFLAPFQALLYITTVIARLGLVQMTAVTRSSSRTMDRTLCILCSAHALACNYILGFLKTRSFFSSLGSSLYSVTFLLPSRFSNSHHIPLTLVLAALVNPFDYTYPLHCIHSSLLFDPRIYNKLFDTSSHAPTNDMTIWIAIYIRQKKNYFIEWNVSDFDNYCAVPQGVDKVDGSKRGARKEATLIESGESSMGQGRGDRDLDGGNGVTLNALAESGDEPKVGEFASATCMKMNLVAKGVRKRVQKKHMQ